jgi:hypothetical protein
MIATETSDLIRTWYEKIQTLNERLWEDRATRTDIDSWLGNFDDDLATQPSERLHALYLLSHFMYFGDREIRVLLRAAYRDLFHYRIIARLRRSMGDTLDVSALHAGFQRELDATRFLGLGNPAESGTHLLYYFRQENQLPKTKFLHTHQIFDRRLDAHDVGLADATVRRLVYLDDFCGSGHQAQDYSEKILSVIRDAAGRAGYPIEVCYYVLFATTRGLDEVRGLATFDDVAAVSELDDSYVAFGADSRYFLTQPDSVEPGFAERMCATYGKQLWPDYPLGYDDSQLLIGFHHNTPDNTLPVIWFGEPSGPAWHPIFRRYGKIDA